MLNLPFFMTYMMPILVIGLVAWLLELYWKRRTSIQSKPIKHIKKEPTVVSENKETRDVAPSLGQADQITKSNLKSEEAVSPSSEGEASLENIKIIFADLAEPQGQVQSDQIFDALALEIQSDSEVLPINLIRASEIISLDEGGRAKLRQTGQKLLKKHDGDVLVWGQYFSDDSGYTLSFLQNETKGKELYTRLLCGLEKIHFKTGALAREDALAVTTIAMAHAFEICDKPQKSKVLALTDLHKRLKQGVSLGEERLKALSREKLWAFAWWSSVLGLQQDHKAKLVEASLLWVDLLKNWPQEESSYDAASARNNLAVVCYFLGQKTKDQVWFERSHKLALKAQSYFRKTGYPRRWSELEFLVLSASSVQALKKKDMALISENEAAFLALQKSWVYDDHSNFWLRIDIELDRLRAATNEDGNARGD